MTKTKLKWLREGYDTHEDMYLIPVGQERTEDDDLNVDAAVAWIKISYDRTRFYHGRGGEGTSRPDSYVAYVQDEHPRRRHLGRVLSEGADATGDVGHILLTKHVPAFRTLTAAKKAIAAELAKIEAKKASLAHGGAWQSTNELPDELCMDEVDLAARCSVCGGPLMPLGTLGNIDHFRCRNCGMDSHARSAS